MGFLLVACALVLLSSTTLTTVVQATQIISHNWRSTYDLVVLPPQTSASAGKAVPADQFEGYGGGISIQQYEQIKKLPGVAVAAPIAFIGYVQYPPATVLFGSDTPQPGFYRVDWTLSAFDGLHHIVEYQDSTSIYIQNCPNLSNGSTILDSKTYTELSTLGVTDDWCNNWGAYQTNALDEGSFLLAAIDPQEEEQLVHLSKSIVNGRMLNEQDTASPDPSYPSLTFRDGTTAPNYDVPMIFNTQLPGQISLHATFVHFQTDTASPQRAVAEGGSTYLSRFPTQSIFSGNVPLAQYDPQLIAGNVVMQWNGSSWQVSSTRGTAQVPLKFLSKPAGLTYQPAVAPVGQTIPAYSLVPVSQQNAGGTSGTEVAFRQQTPFPAGLDQTYNGALFNVMPVGQFDGNRIAAEFSDALNWLPENTYTSPPLTLRYDAQGHPIKPTNLLPTTNTSGFSLQPPLALTTLAAAQRILGNRPISVIRVRIAGNITPDEAGWQHVSQVAQLIEEETGLRALVTIGSSPQPTLIYIPGIKEGQLGATTTIQPLGWAEERWILIGAGFVYLNQLGETRTLFLGAILLVCLGYLIVTLSALVSAQRREMAVLSALGWEPWQAAASFLSQAFILALGGGIVGLGLALLIVFLIGASPPWLLVAWTIPIVLGLAILAALYPLWQLWHVQPAEVLRQGTTVTSARAHARWWSGWLRMRLPAVLDMALRNLARSRLRSLIAMGSLFLSAALLTVMIAGLLAFRQSLQGTLLGNFVLLQTAIPQLVGAIVAVLLTFLSVADLLLLQVRERQQEIGLLQAVGWRPGVVQRLFVQEGLTLALLGAIPGVLVALLVLLVQRQAQGAMGAGAIGVMLVVAALATIPAIRAINHLPLMEVLRAE
ncbi:MAG: FtsX-like permease family protein [Ktedonobacteraceae bacterium]